MEDRNQIDFICKMSFYFTTCVILVNFNCPSNVFFPFMILSAIQEAMNIKFSNLGERRYVPQLAMKFHIYGVSYPPFDCLKYAHLHENLHFQNCYLDLSSIQVEITRESGNVDYS